MPEYVLNRNYLLRTTDGVISFTKGEPVWVTPNMEKHAQSIGAQRCDGVEVDILEEEKKLPPAPAGDERQTQIRIAMELLADRNDSKDFTGQGVPTVKAIEKITGFDVERGEVGEQWAAYKVSLAAE